MLVVLLLVPLITVQTVIVSQFNFAQENCKKNIRVEQTQMEVVSEQINYRVWRVGVSAEITALVHWSLMGFQCVAMAVSSCSKRALKAIVAELIRGWIKALKGARPKFFGAPVTQ